MIYMYVTLLCLYPGVHVSVGEMYAMRLSPGCLARHAPYPAFFSEIYSNTRKTVEILSAKTHMKV